ncbi:hypothetical protein D9M71_699320 [compost metagenome]
MRAMLPFHGSSGFGLLSEVQLKPLLAPIMPGVQLVLAAGVGPGVAGVVSVFTV